MLENNQSVVEVEYAFWPGYDLDPICWSGGGRSGGKKVAMMSNLLEELMQGKQAVAILREGRIFFKPKKNPTWPDDEWPEENYMKKLEPLPPEAAKEYRSANWAKCFDYGISQIIRNKKATIVFWEDGEKTIVRRSDGEQDSLYAAVTAALAKRVYGNNTRFKKMIEKKTKVQK